MSENLKLGQIITTPQQRDAIHIAVVPVEAAHTLHRGEFVKVQNGKAVTASAEEAVGVVDPFLRTNVLHGQQFWLYLNPGSITSLRHDWTHPAFPSSAVEPTAAAMYLQSIADRLGSSLDEVLDAIREGHFCLPNDIDEYDLELDAMFWANYTAHTGLPKPRNDPGYFRCAC